MNLLIAIIAIGLLFMIFFHKRHAKKIISVTQHDIVTTDLNQEPQKVVPEMPDVPQVPQVTEIKSGEQTSVSVVMEAVPSIISIPTNKSNIIESEILHTVSTDLNVNNINDFPSSFDDTTVNYAVINEINNLPISNASISNVSNDNKEMYFQPTGEQSDKQSDNFPAASNDFVEYAGIF